MHYCGHLGHFEVNVTIYYNRESTQCMAKRSYTLLWLLVAFGVLRRRSLSIMTFVI